MKITEELEKKLPPKQKDLLYCLRENNWKVIEIDDEHSDWVYDKKWIIESTHKNKGFQIQLWFFKYDGIHDGVDRVTCTNIDCKIPNPYGSEEDIIDLYFSGKRFEYKLGLFIDEINLLRFND